MGSGFWPWQDAGVVGLGPVSLLVAPRMNRRHGYTPERPVWTGCKRAACFREGGDSCHFRERARDFLYDSSPPARGGSRKVSSICRNVIREVMLRDLNLGPFSVANMPRKWEWPTLLTHSPCACLCAECSYLLNYLILTTVPRGGPILAAPVLLTRRLSSDLDLPSNSARAGFQLARRLSS